MARLVNYLAVALVVVICVCFAGCTTAPSQGTPTPTVRPTIDLTNQNSFLTATFVQYPSRTPLVKPDLNISIKLVASGLTSPMMLTSVPDSSGRLFIVDQIGVVRILTSNGTLLDEPFIDVRDRMVNITPTYDERGLLSIAFPPEYEKNGRVFVYYSAPLRGGAPSDFSCTNRLSEFKVSSNPNKVDLASERILLEVDKPYMNHNGGQLRFGPDDGYLYLPLGDGGRADDTGIGHTPGIGNAQDLTKILGKVIRIDVNKKDPGKEYGIPPDNPFLDNTSIPPEVYAYGFRNPAYASFDSGDNHHYFIAMAGQRLFESVFIVLKGGNYGWNIREGTHCFDPNNDTRPLLGSCPVVGYRGEPLIGPIFEGGHDLGDTIVGGQVYRGNAISELQGKYVFGYWSDESRIVGNGSLYVITPASGDISKYPTSISQLTPSDNAMWGARELTIANNPNGRINAFVRGFGEDANHELYVMVNGVGGPDSTKSTGQVWKIVPVLEVSGKSTSSGGSSG